MDTEMGIFKDNDNFKENDNSGREADAGVDGNDGFDGFGEVAGNDEENGNDGSERDERGEREDGRDEIAQLYQRPFRFTARASDEQIKYVRILLRDAFLYRDDFLSKLEFFRKKTNLTMERADCLIKLGKERLKDYKARQREAQERRW